MTVTTGPLKKGSDAPQGTMKPFNRDVLDSEGPITTMRPMNGLEVRGARLIAFDHSEFSRRDYGRLSMGLKPSGELHMGTVATILNGLLYLESHRDATLKIEIMDLDYDTQRGNNFHSFMRLPDRNGCHGLMKEHTLEKVRKVVEKLSRILGIGHGRVKVQYFTDNYVCEGFAELMTSLIRDYAKSKALKAAVFDHSRKRWQVPFSPICPECGHSSSANGRYLTKEDVITTTCNSSGCSNSGKEFAVPVSIVTGYNVYYLVDPIRDIHSSPSCEPADLHMFGGDYLWTHGQKKKTKVQRSADVMTIETNELPDFFIGPLLTLNRLKMSKSLSAEPADENIAEHIYTRLAEILKRNKDPTLDVWNVVTG